MVDSLLIGDRVRWTSAAGDIRGEVVDIRLGRNFAKELVPWIIVEHIQNNLPTTTMLNGLEQNLSMLNFKVNYRG